MLVQIISFAWTVEPLVRGKKTCTRRNWSDDYAGRFKNNDYVQAFDREPRDGGKCVATIQLTCDPYKEFLMDMTDEEEKAEGGVWGSARAFIEAYCRGADAIFDYELWVIRFQLVKVEPAGMKYLKG